MATDATLDSAIEQFHLLRTRELSPEQIAGITAKLAANTTASTTQSTADKSLISPEELAAIDAKRAAIIPPDELAGIIAKLAANAAAASTTQTTPDATLFYYCDPSLDQPCPTSTTQTRPETFLVDLRVFAPDVPAPITEITTTVSTVDDTILLWAPSLTLPDLSLGTWAITEGGESRFFQFDETAGLAPLFGGCGCADCGCEAGLPDTSLVPTVYYAMRFGDTWEPSLGNLGGLLPAPPGQQAPPGPVLPALDLCFFAEQLEADLLKQIAAKEQTAQALSDLVSCPRSPFHNASSPCPSSVA